MNLKNRFLTFCRQYPGAEDIDQLIKSLDLPTGLKIADFLFRARTIVCEVKTLTTEPDGKLVAYMDENGISPSKLPSGRHIVKQLFEQLEDGQQKYRRAKTLVATSISNDLDDAQKQIRDTKKLFNIPNSDGLLVILNDQVTLAGPPLIMDRLIERLRKTADDQSPYHKDVSHILHVCEKYTPDGENAYLNVTFQNWRAPEANGVGQFVRQFMEKWAAFNGQTFAEAGPQHEKLLKESQLFIAVNNERKPW